jgi:hypothetical protein
LIETEFVKETAEAGQEVVGPDMHFRVDVNNALLPGLGDKLERWVFWIDVGELDGRMVLVNSYGDKAVVFDGHGEDAETSIVNMLSYEVYPSRRTGNKVGGTAIEVFEASRQVGPTSASRGDLVLGVENRDVFDEWDGG